MRNNLSKIMLTNLIVTMLCGSIFSCETLIKPPDFPLPADTTFQMGSPFRSKDGSKIFFFGHYFLEEGWHLYEVDSSGGVPRLLMKDSLAKSHPTLSPDGKKIAYLAAEVGRLLCCAHVWVMNSDGSNARDLTPFDGLWWNVRWSPDSRYVIFDGQVNQGGEIHYQIVRADVETGEAKLILRDLFENYDASYLADGQRIAYTSSRIRTDYGGKVFLMSADGTNPLPLDTSRSTSEVGRPSPVRNELLFFWALAEANVGVYSINLDTVPVPANPTSFKYVYRGDGFNRSQISPDGNMLVYWQGDTRGSLFLINLDGSGLRQITDSISVVLLSGLWSPDSKRLIFEGTGIGNTPSGFFIYELQTNIVKRLNIIRP